MAMPLLLGALILALAPPGSPVSKPCALLTAAEVEAAAGAKVDATQPGEMQLPDNAGTVQTCTWAAKSQGAQIMLSTAFMPPGTDVKALVLNNKGMDGLRAQKWTEESKDYGNMSCTVMSPPASLKQPMYMSACGVGQKGTILSVTFLSPTKKLPLDQIKALTDRAAARLP